MNIDREKEKGNEGTCLGESHKTKLILFIPTYFLAVDRWKLSLYKKRKPDDM